MTIRPRYVGAVLGVGALTLTVLLHRGPLLHPGDVMHALALADRNWLFLAVAAQFASLVAFAEQQRYLLRKFGGTMSLGASVGVTLARTAISVTVPGGSAVSVAWVIRQFRARGISAGAATAVTVLAGLQAIGALLLVYLAWFSTVGLTGGYSSDLGTAVITSVALLAVVFGLRWVRSRTHLGRTVRAFAARWRWSTAIVNVATGAVRHAASLSPRDWAAGGGVALANWLLDVACLVATARAFGLHVGVVQVVGAYLAIQLVRQIPLTPGGVGVVEASLLVTLVALGATSGTAAAVVLTYRLLSTWLLIPIGLLAWAGLRPRPHRDGPPGPATAHDSATTNGPTTTHGLAPTRSPATTNGPATTHGSNPTRSPATAHGPAATRSPTTTRSPATTNDLATTNDRATTNGPATAHGPATTRSPTTTRSPATTNDRATARNNPVTIQDPATPQTQPRRPTATRSQPTNTGPAD